ncbi:hypothetical protein BKA69DRAFT_1043994 [Paraphysoderma sedebokerense]|nr:hypothetical protein BKA69DRAFT_1043994 [Paraphysoderma sedebokerense]
MAASSEQISVVDLAIQHTLDEITSNLHSSIAATADLLAKINQFVNITKDMSVGELDIRNYDQSLAEEQVALTTDNISLDMNDADIHDSSMNLEDFLRKDNHDYSFMSPTHSIQHDHDLFSSMGSTPVSSPLMDKGRRMMNSRPTDDSLSVSAASSKKNSAVPTPVKQFNPTSPATQLTTPSRNKTVTPMLRKVLLKNTPFKNSTPVQLPATHTVQEQPTTVPNFHASPAVSDSDLSLDCSPPVTLQFTQFSKLLSQTNPSSLKPGLSALAETEITGRKNLQSSTPYSTDAEDSEFLDSPPHTLDFSRPSLAIDPSKLAQQSTAKSSDKQHIGDTTQCNLSPISDIPSPPQLQTPGFKLKFATAKRSSSGVDGDISRGNITLLSENSSNNSSLIDEEFIEATRRLSIHRSFVKLSEDDELDGDSDASMFGEDHWNEIGKDSTQKASRDKESTAGKKAAVLDMKSFPVVFQTGKGADMITEVYTILFSDAAMIKSGLTFSQICGIFKTKSSMLPLSSKTSDKDNASFGTVNLKNEYDHDQLLLILELLNRKGYLKKRGNSQGDFKWQLC